MWSSDKTSGLDLSLTSRTFARLLPDGNQAAGSGVGVGSAAEGRNVQTILMIKSVAVSWFESCSLQTNHSLPVCVYNTGLFCLYRKINAATPLLSRLFKFPKTFHPTFLSVLAQEAITKITAVFFFFFP